MIFIFKEKKKKFSSQASYRTLQDELAVNRVNDILMELAEVHGDIDSGEYKSHRIIGRWWMSDIGYCNLNEGETDGYDFLNEIFDTNKLIEIIFDNKLPKMEPYGTDDCLYILSVWHQQKASTNVKLVKTETVWRNFLISSYLRNNNLPCCGTCRYYRYSRSRFAGANIGWCCSCHISEHMNEAMAPFESWDCPCWETELNIFRQGIIVGEDKYAW